jgi:hypothetical protein
VVSRNNLNCLNAEVSMGKVSPKETVLICRALLKCKAAESLMPVMGMVVCLAIVLPERIVLMTTIRAIADTRINTM